ncbi:uncharacterized protein LOC144902465 [Branchiostoma floridae x Branchiostoma belcheri]
MGRCAVFLAIAMSLVHLSAAFKACAYNGVCSCSTGTEVDCDNRDLPVVPDDILPTTARLKLQHNQIVTIGDGKFQSLEHATVIDLSNNLITAIRLQSFAGVQNLEYLDLNYNSIRTVEPGSFQHMQKLAVLHLAYNKLTTLPGNVFSPLSKLWYLDLSNNQIARLNHGIFFGLKNLRSLNVSYNSMSVIPSSIADLGRLRFLDIGHNEILYIQPGMFSNKNNFKHLDLSHNNITMIPKGAFANMTIAENFKLSLKGNPIKQFDEYSFSNIISKEMHDTSFIMDFSHMQLEKIHELAFFNMLDHRKCCYHNNKLLLNDNRLETLPSSLFERQLEACPSPLFGRPAKFNLILSLDNNPWSCDCRMKEILRTKVSISITCQSPPHLKNFKLSSLNPDKLTCSSPTIENCTQVHWAKVGETVTLCCTAIGFNRPTITWSHPLGPPSSIPTDKKPPHYQVSTTKLGYNHSKSTLTINNVEESDMGLYACLASNAAGFNLKSISFSVIPTTGTPTEILIGVAAGTCTGGLVLCTVVALICYKCRQRPEREANSSSENSPQEETWPDTEFDEHESGYYDCVPSEGRPYQGLNVNLSQYQRPLPDIHIEN